MSMSGKTQMGGWRNLSPRNPKKDTVATTINNQTARNMRMLGFDNVDLFGPDFV